jgi:DHA3 family macrolide efflux protein-like MFS transporter
METPAKRPTGMVGFLVVWAGQVVSLLGTAMSNFALTLWAYEVTGRATPLAMIGFFFLAPQVALSPFVGVLVDRGNRKLMMMASDLAAAAVSATILALHLTGQLQIWHLYVTAFVFGTFQGFQWPAYSAAISLMLPKTQYARANGMLEMAGNSSAILAPVLAGALIGPLGLAGILTLDLASAGFAIGALLLVHVPQPPRTAAGQEAAGTFLREALYGFRYIFARPSLLGLQMVFLVGNLFGGVAYAVIAPLLLGRTGNDELVFGTVQSVSAGGGLAGGLLMSVWGGPKRRVHGVLLGWFLSSLLGQVVLGLGQALPVWIAGGFLLNFFNPLINSCNQAIWQAKVAPDVQGRVFTARQFIAWLVLPLSQLLAGPLSDRLLEPGMAAGGSLAPAFGWLVGTGTGAGIGLLFVVTGLLAGLVGLAGYLVPAVRYAEDRLPDHDLAAATT